MFFKKKSKKNKNEEIHEELLVMKSNLNEVKTAIISMTSKNDNRFKKNEVVQVKADNIINYNDATEIQLTDDDRNEIISFLKCLPATIDDDKKYKILSATPGMALLSNGMSATLTSGVIKALNPNGLFRASVEAGKLMAIGGGVGSAVMGSSGIVAQAPFFAAEAAIFAPIIVMQVLSMITGLYYLNGINKQLDEIRKDILQLENFKYMEDASRLESIKLSMNEFFEKNFVCESDLNFIRMNRRDAIAIFKEYSTYLKNIAEEDLSLEKHLTEKGLLKDIYQTTGKTNVNYYANLISAAQNIIFMTYVAELYVYSKLHKKGCNDDIKNLRKKIQNFGISDKSINLALVNKFYDHYEGIIKAHRSKNQKQYEKGEMKEILDKFYTQKKTCIESIEESDPVKEKEAIMEIFDKKKEALLFIDSEGRQALLQEAS